MQVLRVVRFLAEASVVVGQETRQQFIAGANRSDAVKPQFLDQAILQGLVGTLDAALCLRRVGAQNVDVEGVQSPSELGHAVALDSARTIDPKDAVLVAVERDRLAMRLEVLAGRLKVVEGRFRLDELQVHQLTQAIAPRARLMDAFQPVLPPNPNTGADHPLPQCLDAEVQAMKP